jgi:hypothetical protein
LTVGELLYTCGELGIGLSADGPGPFYTAPNGAMTPELQEAMAEHKDELAVFLEVFGDQERTSETPRPVAPLPTARLTDAQVGWEPELEGLIAWFRNARLPTEPFNLARHQRILNPVKFYEALRVDIADGPCGGRGRLGGLAADLRQLREYLLPSKGNV